MSDPKLDDMTMRDLFALFAMQSLLGCSEWRSGLDEEGATCGLEPSEFTAYSAYEIANSMLKAREKANAMLNAMLKAREK